MRQAAVSVLWLLAAVTVFLAAPAFAEPIDSIVALVEEDVILQSELDEAIASIEQQMRAQGEAMPPRRVLEEQMLERIILQRLQLQRAEQTGIRASDADVDVALQQVARQNQMSLSQLREVLEQEGIDYQEFRQEVRREIVTSRLQQRVIDAMDDITETEIDILLASDRFGSQEYLLSQILIGVPDSASPAELRAAEERVHEVRQRLADGMSFSAAAISYSQSPDALEGGDVGWRSLSALPGMFAEVVSELAVGEVSEPLRTPSGFLLLMVRDQRERGEMLVQEYRARYLLIQPSELVSPDAARARIVELRERIEQGEDFAELAREYSSDQVTANIGGLFDWFPVGAYGEQIDQVIASLSLGEVSEPFSSAGGSWQLLQLLDERRSDRSSEIMRAEAREMLVDQKSQEELDRFMREIRNESFVEIRL